MYESLKKNDIRLFLLGLLSLIASAVWAYWPALSGPFLFDDFANLDALAAFNNGFSWDAFEKYFMEGTAGPAGRPLSLLSFLINDSSWPSLPYSFKYTNLLIHVTNGLLLLMLQIRLVTKITDDLTPSRLFIVFLVTSFWVLNPYHVSAVMYVVQRMALLATSFVLLGLVLYVAGREKLEEGDNYKGYLLVWGGYFCGLVLGVLCKENAALFVLLAPLVEWLCFSRRKKRGLLLILTLVLPAIFFIAMAYQWPSFLEQYTWFRDFTLSERLLSQGRILGYYLWRYLIPGVGYTGIYADGFEKSTGLLVPPATLVWLLLHCALFFLALFFSKKKPLVSLGILFFYVANVMESSVVPLELFFEHRAYLPSSLLLIGLAHYKKISRMVVVLSVAIVIFCVCLLHLRAGYWGSQPVLKAIMVNQNPSSERARIDQAKYLVAVKELDKAVFVLDEYKEDYSPGIELAANLVALKCVKNMDNAEDVALLIASPKKYRAKAPMLVRATISLVEKVENKSCKALGLDDIGAFLDSYIDAYPRDAQSRQGYHIAKAHLELARTGYEGFHVEVKKALSEWENRELITGVCSELYNLGHPDDSCECYMENKNVFYEWAQQGKSLPQKIFGYNNDIGKVFSKQMLDACGAVPEMMENKKTAVR